MLQNLLIAFITSEVFFLIGCFFARNSRTSGCKMNQKLKVSMPVITFGAELLLLLLTDCMQRYLMAGQYQNLPMLFVFFFSLLINGAVFGYLWSDRKLLKRTLPSLAIMACVLFVMEYTVFNAKSFSTARREYVVTPIDVINEAGCEWTDDGQLIVGSEDEFYIKGALTVEKGKVKVKEKLPAWTRCASLQMEYVKEPDEDSALKQYRPFRVSVFMCDGNFHTSPQISGRKMYSIYGKDVNFALLPYQELEQLNFFFKDMQEDAYLKSVTLYDAVPFSFSFLRYLSLFGIIGLFLVNREFHFTRIAYDRNKRSHRIAAGCMTGLCILSLLWYFNPHEKLEDFPDQDELQEANPYVQMIDAFQKGQLNLDLEIDKNLINCEYPYDRVGRDENEIKYVFDRSFYNGKYYSYFGVAPVLTFMYPVYRLTGKVPTLAQTCYFYAPFTVLFLCLMIFAAARLCCKKPNFLLLMLMLPAATLLCGVLYCQQHPNMYDVVVASGLCFMMLLLWSGMQSVLVKKKWLRMLLFVICGISCVLCVHSRPSMAISALTLTPFFLKILLDKEQPVRSRIGQAAAFVIPVIIGAAATMYYNAQRFSSPFDFGAGYQLTISNVQANTLRLSALPAVIFHYFMQAPSHSSIFPFFKLSLYSLDNYHMYNNMEHTMGTLCFPMMLLGALLVPRAVRSGITGKATLLQTRAEIIMLFSMAVLTAWLDFCIGGVSLRYTIDYMPVILLGTIIVLLNTIRTPQSRLYRIAVLSVAASIVITILLLIQHYVEGSNGSVLIYLHPEIPEILEDAFIFWD